MEEPTEIIVCQGAPRCQLEGDDAMAAQQAGCVWCERIVIDEFGDEDVSGPSSQ